MSMRALCVAAVSLATAFSGGAAYAADGAPHPSAASGSVWEDFDGDGYQDLATAAPEATISGQARAGYVVVTYGSATGLDTDSRVFVSQDTASVPGSAETDDRFGAKLVARDLDGDGLTDLAVHAAGETVASTNSYGTVTVLWGRAGGLTTEGAVAIKAPAGSSGWQVGNDLTGGDFNGDDHTDLVMRHGDDWETRSVLTGPFTRSGTPAGEQQVVFSTDNDILTLTSGDMTGDGIDDLATFYAYENHAEGGKFWRGTASGLSTTPSALRSAAAATVGDFDKDGKGDLATRTVPNEITEDIPYDAGTIKIYYGTATGPSSSRVTTITQDTSGVPGTSEKGDQFGARLDAGDVNGDGYADLAAGVPFEAVGTKTAAGSVTLLKGAASGLSGSGAQTFTQDSAGIAGVAESGDRFGGAVHLLDVTKNGKADLAVSAPQENGTGAVWSLLGGSGGLTATGSVAFNPVDLGTSAPGARFGASFANENTTFLYGP